MTLSAKLLKIISHHSLGSAYIFYGEDRRVCFQESYLLARLLETGTIESNHLLLDLSVISPVGRSVGLDSIHLLKNFLSTRPLKSSRRAVIIKDADSLTREASNALLKISEDSPPSALIILITRQRDSLLPTILSRFQALYFSIHETPPLSPDKEMFITKFLSAPLSNRRFLIKELVGSDDPNTITDFLENLILHLSSDPLKNKVSLKSSLALLADMKEFQLNPRLQLEALSENI